MDPLHATIEECAAEGYTHIECSCPRCRFIRRRPMSWLPKISKGVEAVYDRHYPIGLTNFQIGCINCEGCAVTNPTVRMS